MTLKDLLKDGYTEGMTLEDVEKALENVTIPADSGEELKKLREALTKSNKEAADYKKELRAKQTEDEIKAEEQKKAQEELQTKYDDLLRKVTISENKAQFIAMGYDEKLADETAKALADGDMVKVFANQKKAQEIREKQIREEILKGNPRPDGNGNGKTMTAEEIMNISDPVERQQAIAKNISLFERG